MGQSDSTEARRAMGKGSTNEGLPHGSGERGLWRLMLKLPALRGRLQILAARHDSLINLFEAYEDASVTLQRLRTAPGEQNRPLALEYETTCSEIEAEVIEYCLKHPGVPE
jgi:hypothetical protein